MDESRKRACAESPSIGVSIVVAKTKLEEVTCAGATPECAKAQTEQERSALPDSPGCAWTAATIPVTNTSSTQTTALARCTQVQVLRSSSSVIEDIVTSVRCYFNGILPRKSD